MPIPFRNESGAPVFYSTLRKVPILPTSNPVSRGRHGIRRVFSQLIIGCGIALVSVYSLRIFGVEIATFDLALAFLAGIFLIIAGIKLQPFRRVPRVH